MSYNQLGQLPGASSFVTAAISAQAGSIVPSVCSTLDALREMNRWEAPPANLPQESALVFAVRLPEGTGNSTGTSVAVAAGASMRRIAEIKGWRVSVQRDYYENERIAWIAIWVSKNQTSPIGQALLNSAANGAIQSAMLGQRLSHVPAPPIYFPPARMQGVDADMRREIYITGALRSALVWEDFRVALAVGLFGQASLNSNISRRTPNTGFSELQAGAQAASQAPQVAAAAIAIAETAITAAQGGDAATAGQALRQARGGIQTALSRIDEGLRLGPNVAARAAQALSTIRTWVSEAVEATKGRITERDPTRRQYAECKLWTAANDRATTFRTTFAGQRDQAPVLLASLRANAPGARAALETALHRVNQIAERVDAILGPWWTRPLGPLPVWGWGAIGVTTFLGGAALLRRARRKRPKKNSRRSSRPIRA